MKSPLPQRRARAFSLVELLAVMAIIALLAALFLPVMQRAKAQAKLIGCQNNLEQLGIAFHSFAHDHNSKFPMQTPVADGGAQEFVQNGYLVKGDFYFAYRNFQPLAEDLETPKILICPTDTRRPATNFSSLQNTNLSYFVDVDADYNQPQSILTGDRNLVAGPGPSIISAAGQTLHWTGIMHQYRGNLLFADGHVEESKVSFLVGETSTTSGLGAQNNFFVPSAKPEPALAQLVSANTGFSSRDNSMSVVNNQDGLPSNLTKGSNLPPFSAKPTLVTNLNYTATNSPASNNSSATTLALNSNLPLGNPKTASAAVFNNTANISAASLADNNRSSPTSQPNGNSLPATSPKPSSVKGFTYAGNNLSANLSSQPADAPPTNPAALNQPTTNVVTAVTAAGYSVMAYFFHYLAKHIRKIVGWDFLWLLLLLLLLLALELRRRWRQGQKL